MLIRDSGCPTADGGADGSAASPLDLLIQSALHKLLLIFVLICTVFLIVLTDYPIAHLTDHRFSTNFMYVTKSPATDRLQRSQVFFAEDTTRVAERPD